MTQEMTAASTIDRLESRLNDLHEESLFTRDRDRLTETNTTIGALPGRIAALRARHYVYNATFEERATDLAGRWAPAQTEANANLLFQATALQIDYAGAASAVSRLSPLKSRSLSTAQPTIDRVEQTLAAAEKKVDAVHRSLTGMYEPTMKDIQALERDVHQCERNMDWLDGACFQVNAGESLVDATEAKKLDGRDEMEGILYATDQRLLFERREKVARKKVLFITTASELVKELIWEAPLSELEAIEASEARKLLSKRELLAITPASGSAAIPAQFRLDTDSDAWRAMLLRCKTGEIDAARDESAAPVQEYIVPAKCPTCGGAQSKAGRIRGIAALRCEYCGTNIMLEKAE